MQVLIINHLDFKTVAAYSVDTLGQCTVMLRGGSEMWQCDGWVRFGNVKMKRTKDRSEQKMVICCGVSPFKKKWRLSKYKLCYDVVLLQSPRHLPYISDPAHQSFIHYYIS